MCEFELNNVRIPKIRDVGSNGIGTTLVGTGTNPVLVSGTDTTLFLNVGTGTTLVLFSGTGTTLVWVPVSTCRIA